MVFKRQRQEISKCVCFCEFEAVRAESYLPGTSGAFC